MSVSKHVVIDYTNHRGERRERRVIPYRIFFGLSPYHEGVQWLLDAVDVDKSEMRTFAVKDIHSWRPAPEAPGEEAGDVRSP